MTHTITRRAIFSNQGNQSSLLLYWFSPSGENWFGYKSQKQSQRSDEDSQIDSQHFEPTEDYARPKDCNKQKLVF